MTEQLAGVLPVMQTPFDADENLDRAAHARLLDWTFDNGADGIVVAMVSEVLRLTAAERDELNAVTAQACEGRGTSVASVGAESTRIAVGHARTAQAAGATALMATPPMLTRLDEPALRRYFATVIEAVDIPVVVQDASGYVGQPLSVELQAGLHAEFGDRAMFKPEAHPIGPRITQLMDATGGAARIFDGTGGLHLVDTHRRGVVGTMPAADLIWALSALWRALEDGDDDRTYAIAGPLAQIVSLQTTLDSFVVIEKHLLQQQGVLDDPRMRGPVAAGIDDHTRAELDRLVVRLRAAVTAA
ncbi:dihydrodipicolinate synthase family protein [Microlunatus sp. Y2014]|uniref:dihydrodipicolinate synthase family protein n=1 Tax=Microlunatus sp. Y2014 TaxID=3418488 RepID=UPI003DA6FDD4